MAKSLLDSVGDPCSPSNAVLAIIRGSSSTTITFIFQVLNSIFFFVGNLFCYIFNLLTGHKRSLDVATIMQGETKFFSVLMLAWGMTKISTACFFHTLELHVTVELEF